jgi:hypothetical protein
MNMMVPRLLADPVLALVFAQGCGGSSSLGISSAAPPTIICGTTLDDTPGGAVVEDATHNHRVITAASARMLVFVRVSDSCASGATVTWTPAHQAVLVAQAKAKDGKAVAVALRPATRHAKFRLRATRDGHVTAWTTVSLSKG